jgi:lysophospholipase L1-like esterase
MNRILNRLSANQQTTTVSEQGPSLSATVSRRERLRLIALKAATTVVSTLILVSVLLGADLYLHHKHGINLWGYRGPAVGQKQPEEKRIAVLGGSTAWGYGVKVGQDFPGQLQRLFGDRPRLPGGASIEVLNLAYNREGAYSFKYTLQDYDYLNYDVVLLYGGQTDLGPQNLSVFRHRSPVFLWTGYLPLLPALTMDKISVWTNQLTKEEKPVVFSPPAGNDSETGEQTSKSLQKQLGALTDKTEARPSADGTCPEQYISDEHVEQQRALEAMLKQRFQGQAHLGYLNLGRTVDLQDRSLCSDGMHLTEEGNRRIAEALIQPVLEILQR